VDFNYSLKAADHTYVMKAVIDRPLNVIHYLTTPKGAAPTPEQVLEAALKVRAFDERTKSILREVADLHPKLKAVEAQIPPSTLTALNGIIDKMKGESVDKVLAMLAKERAQDSDLAPTIEATEQILRDGAATIYSPDYAPAEYLNDPNTDASSAAVGIVAADGAGAVVGGAGGAILGATAGGVGALPGAAIGAAGGAVLASASGAITAALLEAI
jgi:predicted transcriptional regulator